MSQSPFNESNSNCMPIHLRRHLDDLPIDKLDALTVEQTHFAHPVVFSASPTALFGLG